MTSGVIHPAQGFTRGNVSASMSAQSTPRRRSAHAHAAPPGPAPTISTSARIIAAPTRSSPQHPEQEFQPPEGGELDLLDGVGHLHGREEVAVEVDLLG